MGFKTYSILWLVLLTVNNTQSMDWAESYPVLDQDCITQQEQHVATDAESLDLDSATLQTHDVQLGSDCAFDELPVQTHNKVHELITKDQLIGECIECLQKGDIDTIHDKRFILEHELNQCSNSIRGNILQIKLDLIDRMLACPEPEKFYAMLQPGTFTDSNVPSRSSSRSQSSLAHDKVNQYRRSHSSTVVKVAKDPVFTKWQEKQLSGDKVSLKAQQSFLKRKLAESLVLNRKKYEHELRIINSLLSQELTSTLYKVKQGSLTEAELIVHNLQKQLQSEMGRIRTAIDEAVAARQRIDRLEFEYNHARALLEKREDYQIKQRELAQQQLQTVDLVSTPVHPEINISVDVDMRIEAALSRLNAIDPAQDLEGFLALSQTVLDDLREQGLLNPELNQDQEILAIFAKAVLRRLNPITQFKDVTKLTYYLGKKIFCEMHPYWTAAEIERAHSSWDRFYETLKTMDPRSLTQEQWAEFLGTVVGDFAFFGGIGKVVHYFAQAPVTIEAIQARPLDYAHSVIQYVELKTALQVEEFTSIINVTNHGLQRLIQRNFSPKEILSLLSEPTYARIQADGAKVFIKELANKRYNFIVINETTGEVVTALRKIDTRAVVNQGKNYGWKL